MQRLIGMLSSVKDRASGEDKARVIRSPSPVAHRLIKQLLVTLDEDAALSEDEGVCGKFGNIYDEAETLADGDMGHGSDADSVVGARAAGSSQLITRFESRTSRLRRSDAEKYRGEEDPAYPASTSSSRQQMEHSADDAMQEQRRARVERARERAVANRKRREREAKLRRWREEARIKAEDELAKEEVGGTVSKVRIEDVKKFNEVFHDVEPLEPSETAAWSDLQLEEYYTSYGSERPSVDESAEAASAAPLDPRAIENRAAEIFKTRVDEEKRMREAEEVASRAQEIVAAARREYDERVWKTRSEAAGRAQQELERQQRERDAIEQTVAEARAEYDRRIAREADEKEEEQRQRQKRESLLSVYDEKFGELVPTRPDVDDRWTEDDIKNYYTSLGAVVPKFGVVTTNDAGVPAASVSLEESDAAVDDAKTKSSPKEYAKILKALRHTNLEFAEKFAGREEQLMVMRHAVRAICKRHRIPDVLANIHQNIADNNGRYVEEVQSDDALAINDEIGRMILAKLTIEKQKEMLKRGVTSATRIMATLQQPFGFGGVRRLALEKQLKDLRLQQTAAPIHDMLWRADLIEEELTELGTSTDARTRWEVRCQAARSYGPKVSPKVQAFVRGRHRG